MRKTHVLSAVTLSALILAALPVNAKVDISSQTASIHQTRRTPSEPSLIGTPSLAQIARGEILEFGHSGPAVEIIRSLMLELDYTVEASGELYDRELAWQIGQFQEAQQLAAPGSEHYGKVGAATLKALQQLAARGRYNTELGVRLADYARSHVRGTRRYCYHYVANAIHAFISPFLKGNHAYMAAPQLASSGYFKEIQVPADALPTLPVGAVVVWDKGSSRSGHISIADGNGNEISDHISRQMVYHYGGASHRVFLPVARS